MVFPPRVRRLPRRGRAEVLRAAAAAIATVVLGMAVDLRAVGDDLAAKVKAAYIYNFLTFVEWEEAGTGSTLPPIKICVLSDDAVLAQLKGLSHKEVRGRSLQVVGVSKVSDVLGCHLLVVGGSEAAQLPALFRHLVGANTLTVSDIPQFSRRGGVIGFVTEAGRVKIEINQRMASQARVKISAKLLEVARLVP